MNAGAREYMGNVVIWQTDKVRIGPERILFFTLARQGTNMKENHKADNVYDVHVHHLNQTFVGSYIESHD
jgi:hypothetical protein